MAYIKPVRTLGLYSRQRKACGVRSINPASLDQLFIPSYAVQYALGVRPGYVGPGCGKWLRAGIHLPTQFYFFFTPQYRNNA